MRVLVACEESQTITKTFRMVGVEAWSCDILPCSGGKPEWHIQNDVLTILNDGWDIMIAHPPCTFLTGSGVQWLSNPDDKKLNFDERRPHPKYPNRRRDMIDSIDFIKQLWNANINKIAIENPIGLLNTMWRKPDQIIQPYFFGDEATKSTCLWLKNLKPLVHVKESPLFPGEITHVDKGERTFFASGKSHPKWYADALSQSITKEERQTLRSKTFQGIANAMVKQWL